MLGSDKIVLWLEKNVSYSSVPGFLFHIGLVGKNIQIKHFLFCFFFQTSMVNSPRFPPLRSFIHNLPAIFDVCLNLHFYLSILTFYSNYTWSSWKDTDKACVMMSMTCFVSSYCLENYSKTRNFDHVCNGTTSPH